MQPRTINHAYTNRFGVRQCRTGKRLPKPHHLAVLCGGTPQTHQQYRDITLMPILAYAVH